MNMARRRRNRPIVRKSKVSSVTGGTAGLILTLFASLMIYWNVDSRCSRISGEIGKAEAELKSREAELVRERARWDEMKTPARLSVALNRYGLAMEKAESVQIVRMDRDGLPKAGQISVARAKARRERNERVAQAAPSVERRRR